AILFNGGVFQPQALRDRLLDVLRHWYVTPGSVADSLRESGGDSLRESPTGKQPWQPLVLSNPSLDLAVAWGAAHYAWLRHSGGRRIGGGIARSYYVGIAGGPDQPDAGTATVVCVVPQHLEEGQELILEKPELELALGQPVAFPLYTSTVRGEDRAGDV